jgi:tRNA U38,U39,U40 pseudouridine synthase TruA
VMVSTAVGAARDGADDDALARLASTGERGLAAAPAPAEPLTLVRVSY